MLSKAFFRWDSNRTTCSYTGEGQNKQLDFKKYATHGTIHSFQLIVSVRTYMGIARTNQHQSFWLPFKGHLVMISCSDFFVCSDCKGANRYYLYAFSLLSNNVYFYYSLFSVVLLLVRLADATFSMMLDFSFRSHRKQPLSLSGLDRAIHEFSLFPLTSFSNTITASR